MSKKKRTEKKTIFQFFLMLFSFCWSIRTLTVLLSTIFIAFSSFTVFGIGRILSNEVLTENVQIIREFTISTVTFRVKDMFSNYVHTTNSIQKVVYSLVNAMELDLNDFNASFNPLFNSIIRITSEECGFVVASEKVGNFFVGRIINGVLIGSFGDRSTEGSNQFIYSQNYDIESKKFIGDLSLFYGVPYDPRVRDWYIKAKEISYEESFDQFRWVNMYVTKVGNLAFNVVAALYDKNKTFYGTVAGYINLSGNSTIDYLLRQTKREIFEYKHVDIESIVSNFLVITSNGYIVGTSFDSDRDLFKFNETTHELFRIDEHPNELVMNIGKHILTEFGSFNEVPRSHELIEVFDSFSGRYYLMEVEGFDDGYGLKFFTVVLLNKDKVFSIMNLNLVYSLIGVVVCIAISILISSIFSLFVSYPIYSVTWEIEKILKLEELNVQKGCLKDLNLLKLHELNGVDKSLKKLKKGLVDFAKFIPKDILFFFKSRKRIKRTLKQKYATIIFCDIIAFTTISERLSNKELITFLTKFFEIVEKSIIKHRGVVDKFIGDCVMAIFGAPKSLKNHERLALESILQIQDTFKKKNRKQSKSKKKKLPAIKITAGICSGSCLIGFIGTRERYSYTALGDCVNTASRLQSMCSENDASILLGERTYNAFKYDTDIEVENIGKKKLKGKSIPIEVFKIVGRTRLENEECNLDINVKIE